MVRVSKTLAGYNVSHQCYDCLFFRLFDRFAFQFWIMINIPKKQKFWLVSQVYLRGSSAENAILADGKSLLEKKFTQ